MKLDDYRRSAEEFVSELTGEYYRHFAGLKDSYEIELIYRRHAGLFEREAIEQLRAAVADAAGGSEEHQRARMLLDFAVEGFVGQATKATEAELARRETSMTIELHGGQVGFRESAVIQANEPDAGRRWLIERARLELIDRELGHLHRALLERQHECARQLGWSSYREMCEQCKSIDFGALRDQTDAFAAASEPRYTELLEPELRRTLDLGLGELRRSDLPRFFRAAEQDAQFPAERLVPSFTETMRGLGVDVHRQVGVTLDVEQRPKKSPRAFCAPVRTPGEVYLVIAPVGGWDDYSALFHEGGHTEHAAHVDPRLPFEFRYLGDNSITEAYAFLFQHLVEDPEWLSRRLGVQDPAPLLSHARAQRLVYLRRYSAKLAYELELHSNGGDPAALAERYSRLLGDALKIEWPPEMFVSDVDPGFYCACYLRAWALETHLRSHLRERFGPAWFESAEAGTMLRRLWAEGQRSSPEELLTGLTGEPLDFRVLLDDLALAGRSGD